MRRFTLALLLAGLVLLAACSWLAPAPVEPTAGAATPPIAPSLTPTSLPTEAPSPAAEPTLSPSPTAEPTPDLSWIQEAPLSEIEFRLPLTIRHLTDQQVVLQFVLEEEAPADIYLWRVWDHGGLRQIEADGDGGIFIVDDLEAGTEYEAVVLIEGETPSKPMLLEREWPLLSFRTMDYQAEGFRAAVFGDSGFGDQVTLGLVESMAEQDPDMVLHTGDVVYKLQEDPNPALGYKEKLYRTHQAVLVGLPFYAVPGNHEYDAAAQWQGQPYFLEAFPKLEAAGIHFPPGSDGSWYSFSHGGIQFLMLNTQSIFGQPGEAEQRAWLEERVADEAFRYSVIVLHVPPYNLGRHQGAADIVRSRWGELLIHPRVPLVLAGHDHNYQRWQVDSTAVIVSGGGSAVLYGLSGGDPNYRSGARASHYVLADFGRDLIGLRVIDRNGEVIDEASINLQQ